MNYNNFYEKTIRMNNYKFKYYFFNYLLCNKFYAIDFFNNNYNNPFYPLNTSCTLHEFAIHYILLSVF